MEIRWSWRSWKKFQDFTGLSFCPYGYNQLSRKAKCVALTLVRHFSHFGFVTFWRWWVMSKCYYTVVRACLQLFLKSCSSFLAKYFRIEMVRCYCWSLFASCYWNIGQLCYPGSSLNRSVKEIIEQFITRPNSVPYVGWVRVIFPDVIPESELPTVWARCTRILLQYQGD